MKMDRSRLIQQCKISRTQCKMLIRCKILPFSTSFSRKSLSAFSNSKFKSSRMQRTQPISNHQLKRLSRNRSSWSKSISLVLSIFKCLKKSKLIWSSCNYSSSKMKACKHNWLIQDQSIPRQKS